jgi:hypothetical protein
MVFTPGGRERTADQFDALWRRANLRCVERAALPSGGRLFTLRA